VNILVALIVALSWGQIPADSVGCAENGFAVREVTGGVVVIDREQAPDTDHYRIEGSDVAAEVVGTVECSDGTSVPRVRMTWTGDAGRTVKITELDVNGEWLATTWQKPRS
jgi:hypothetical protein